MQRFKGDQLEGKFIDLWGTSNLVASSALNDFFNNAYDDINFKSLLYDEGRTPFSNSIVRQIFIDSFTEIIEALGSAGTLETYLTVFSKVFGDDVEVTFTADNLTDPGKTELPGPGCLKIDIVATGLQLDFFAALEVIEGQFVLSDIVDHEGDNIVFESVKGFTSQYDLEQMLFEMVVGGVYTEISLQIGE